MRKVLGYILSPIYWLYFGLLLVIFHVIQVICRKIGGYSLRKKSVDILNYFLLYGLIIVGARIRFKDLKPAKKLSAYHRFKSSKHF